MTEVPQEIFDEERPGWVTASMSCKTCGTTQQAVFHVRTEGGKLECHVCHAMCPMPPASEWK